MLDPSRSFTLSPMDTQRENSRRSAQAAGRCTATLIFAIFGGCWLLLSCTYFKRINAWNVGGIVITVLVLALVAKRLQRGAAPASEGAFPQGEKKRNDRIFGIINAVTYTAVFLLFFILPRLGLQNYIFPSFVALVGLHFFPMPPLYQHRANQVTGGFMILWAATCAILFKADGNRMAAFVTLGAGLALWISAIWALKTARMLLAAPHIKQPVGAEFRHRATEDKYQRRIDKP